MVESAALVHARFGHAAARRLLGDFFPAIELLWVDGTLHAAAASAFMASSRSGVSFVDRISFELMRRERIGAAFAFDRDFAREGFQLVPKRPGR